MKQEAKQEDKKKEMELESSKMIKTTINIPEKTWRDFSIEVIREYGGRKKNDVIVDLINEYLKKKEKE